MRTINYKSRKFAIGKSVIVIQTYVFGAIRLSVGDVGKVVGESYTNLPYFGLFDIRVIDMDFNGQRVSMGEAIAEVYLEELK